MVNSAVFFQGVTMDFRTVYAQSIFVQKQVVAMQKKWQEQNICRCDLVGICEGRTEYTPEEKTQYEQPAIFAVSLAKLYEVQQTFNPDLYIGHSFGEYAAICAAGVVPEKLGYVIAQKRGELAKGVNVESPGLMAAVSGKINLDVIQQACLRYSIDIANINSPEQVVISGEKRRVQEACAHLKKSGFAVTPLDTGCAFHSRELAKIQNEFRQFLGTIPFQSPETPIIMNATAQIETNPERIKDCLASQLTAPVDFPKIVTTMRENGVDTEKSYEVGLRNTLKGFAKKILKGP